MNLEGKTAFVTGGSGFIGGRLIEVLAKQYGMKVKALVRGTTTAGGGAFRAAAAGAEMVFGSLLDEAALAESLKGCDFVFHCAYGTHGSAADQREVTLEGTRLLARAAGKAGASHFIHLSTIATFGGNTPPLVDENFVNPKLWDWPYAHDKLDAEEALRSESQAAAMPFTILRLGAVYGPYGAAYTTGPIGALKAGRLALVNDGDGVSSATYVDDVIQAMVLAAQKAGTGETYMIRGPDRVTWRQLYEAYDAMVGQDSLVSMTPAEMRKTARGMWKVAARQVLPQALAALKGSPGFRRAAVELPYVRTAYAKFGKKLLNRGSAAPGAPAAAVPAVDSRPIQLIPEIMIDYFVNTSEFSIDKARRELGYAPQYDLAKGMALTEQWSRWANLIP